MFVETPFASLPPPTEKTSSVVGRRSREPVQPLGEGGVPALVVGPGGQLRDVVGRRVGLEVADLAEVVDRVRGVAGRSADAEDEQPAAAIADGREADGDRLDRVGVERFEDRRRLR